MATDTAADTATGPAFEDLLAGLENVVRKLEEEQLGLGEALKYYEQGIRFLRKCHESLCDAEQKIEVLSGVDAAGKVVTSTFEVTVETLEDKQQSRSRKRTRPLE